MHNSQLYNDNNDLDVFKNLTEDTHHFTKIIYTRPDLLSSNKQNTMIVIFMVALSKLLPNKEMTYYPYKEQSYMVWANLA